MEAKKIVFDPHASVLSGLSVLMGDGYTEISIEASNFKKRTWKLTEVGNEKDLSFLKLSEEDDDYVRLIVTGEGLQELVLDFDVEGDDEEDDDEEDDDEDSWSLVFNQHSSSIPSGIEFETEYLPGL